CTATLARAIEVEDSVSATLRFASGALGSLTATTAAAPGFPHRVEVYGSEGGVQLEGEAVVRWSRPGAAGEPAAAVAAGPGAAGGGGGGAGGAGGGGRGGGGRQPGRDRHERPHPRDGGFRARGVQRRRAAGAGRGGPPLAGPGARGIRSGAHGPGRAAALKRE